MKSVTLGAHRGSDVSQLVTRFRDAGILGVVILVAVIFSIVEPLFLTAGNLLAITVSLGIIVVLAMGQMLVIVTRQIDLSIGSTLGVAAMVMGMVGRDFPDTPLPFLIAISIAAGAVCGGINGLLVAVAGVPSIIATLGTLAIFRGAVFVISDNVQVNPSEIPVSVTALNHPSPLGLPWIVLIALLVILAAWFYTRRTMSGLRLFAIGSNPIAAVERGLRVRGITFAVFTVMGALAGLGGALYVARFATVNAADVGVGFELTVISAVVIGGTNIFGGSGSVVGVVLGCALVGILSNGLTVIGVSGFWQSAAEGAIILLAVITDAAVRRRLLAVRRAA
jgi:rhamnose transport system permease protein